MNISKLLRICEYTTICHYEESVLSIQSIIFYVVLSMSCRFMCVYIDLHTVMSIYVVTYKIDLL